MFTMETEAVTECRICGDEVVAEETEISPESGLCGDCSVLQDSAEILMSKNPKKALHYFTDLFMQARRRTLSAEKLENCIWEAWWSGQRDNCTSFN
jgi:hypothetical protein